MNINIKFTYLIIALLGVISCGLKSISGNSDKSVISDLPFKFSSRELIIESGGKYEALGIINIEADSYNIRLLNYVNEYYCQLVSKYGTSNWFSIGIDLQNIKNLEDPSTIKLFQDIDSKNIFILYEEFSEHGQVIGVTAIGPGNRHIETSYGPLENPHIGNGQVLDNLDINKLQIKYSSDSKDHLVFSYPDIPTNSSVLRLYHTDSSEISSTHMVWDRLDIFSEIYDNKKSITITKLRLKHNENDTPHEVEINWNDKIIHTKNKISDSSIVFNNGSLVITERKYMVLNSFQSTFYNMKYTFTLDDKFMQPMLSNLSITKHEFFKDKFLDSIEYWVPFDEKYIFPLSLFSDNFSDFVLVNLMRRFDLNSLVGLCERDNYYYLFNTEFPTLEEQDELFRTNKPTKENADKYFFLGSHLSTNSIERLKNYHGILLKGDFLCLALAKKVYEHLVELDTANDQYVLGLADVKWELYNSTFPTDTNPYEDHYPFKDDSWISDYKKYINLKSKNGVIDRAISERIQQRLKNK